jgi:hypothetical protein
MSVGRRLRGIRHRVVTAASAGAATGEPAGSQPYTAARAVALDRLISELGARGLVPAGDAERG